MALTASALEDMRMALADLCEEAKTLVKGGAQYKATILLRAPHLPDGDVLVSEDSNETIIAAIKRRGTVTVRLTP